jgi:cytochrome P450
MSQIPNLGYTGLLQYISRSYTSNPYQRYFPQALRRWDQRSKLTERSNAGGNIDAVVAEVGWEQYNETMDPTEFIGNLIVLIIGGNDTTRNSISG